MTLFLIYMNKRLKTVIEICLGVIIFTLVYWFINKKFNIGIPCVYHELTGLYCPGCGLTRMIFYLLSFDFYHAFRSNMLMFIIIPFFVVLIADYIVSYIKYNKPLIYKIKPVYWIILLVIAVIFGVARNIFPFLAPIEIEFINLFY